MKTWNLASQIYVGVHPVPGTFGVRALHTIALYALNMSLPVDQALVVFNATGTMALVVYTDKSGRTEMTKHYAKPGCKFRIVAKVLNSNNRTVALTRKEIEGLLDDQVPLVDKGQSAGSKP